MPERRRREVTKAPQEKVKCFVVFGKDTTILDELEDKATQPSELVHEYTFANDGERQAFILGLGEMTGWMDFYLAENAAEAVTYIEGLQEEQENDEEEESDA